MNKGVVVFLKEERFVAELIVSGVSLNVVYLQVSPLAVPTARVEGVPRSRRGAARARQSESSTKKK